MLSGVPVSISFYTLDSVISLRKRADHSCKFDNTLNLKEPKRLNLNIPIFLNLREHDDCTRKVANMPSNKMSVNFVLKGLRYDIMS